MPPSFHFCPAAAHLHTTLYSIILALINVSTYLSHYHVPWLSHSVFNTSFTLEKAAGHLPMFVTSWLPVKRSVFCMSSLDPLFHHPATPHSTVQRLLATYPPIDSCLSCSAESLYLAQPSFDAPLHTFFDYKTTGHYTSQILIHFLCLAVLITRRLAIRSKTRMYILRLFFDLPAPCRQLD